MWRTSSVNLEEGIWASRIYERMCMTAFTTHTSNKLDSRREDRFWIYFVNSTALSNVTCKGVSYSTWNFQNVAMHEYEKKIILTWLETFIRSTRVWRISNSSSCETQNNNWLRYNYIDFQFYLLFLFFTLKHKNIYTIYKYDWFSLVTCRKCTILKIYLRNLLKIRQKIDF